MKKTGRIDWTKNISTLAKMITDEGEYATIVTLSYAFDKVADQEQKQGKKMVAHGTRIISRMIDKIAI